MPTRLRAIEEPNGLCALVSSPRPNFLSYSALLRESTLRCASYPLLRESTLHCVSYALFHVLLEVF
jgi:hypothetical protein